MNDNPTYLLSEQQALTWRTDLANGLMHGPVQVTIRVESAVTHHEIGEHVLATVQRHEILRSTYAAVSGHAIGVQTIHDELEPEIRAVSGPLQPALLAERAPFALDQSPLRIAICNAGTDDACCIITLSPLAADAVSAAIVANEVLHGTASDEPLQYADYAAWQEDLLSTPAPASARQRGKTGSFAETVAIPFLAGRLVESGSNESSHAFTTIPVPVSLTSVQAAAARLNVDPATIAQAAWIAWLARTNRAQSIEMPTAIDGRTNPELAGAVGSFTRVVPLRLEVDVNQSFPRLVASVAEARAEATQLHEFHPSQLEIDRGTAQLCPGFSSVAITPELLSLHEYRSMQCGELRWCGERAELLLNGSVDSAVIHQLAASLGAMLMAACADDTSAIAELNILHEHENESVQQSATGPVTPHIQSTFTACFEEQAARTPDRIAVANGATTLTYQELDMRSNQFARILQQRGTKLGDTVGLLTDRSPIMLVALLGILKAGAAYVPLNHEHPAARIAYQLAETQSSLVVATAEYRHHVPASIEAVVIDDPTTVEDVPCTQLDGAALITADHAAYILYTSGSTGTPKGVVVTHANLTNYAVHIAELLGAFTQDAPTSGLRCGVVTAISTDLGNTCIMPPLVSGGSVHLFDTDTAVDPYRFANHLRSYPIDVLKITPSHFSSLFRNGGPTVLPNRLLIFGGEASSWDTMRAVRAAAPNLRILNHYGPTETTIGACTYPVGDEPVNWHLRSVPIGFPITNLTCDVVDTAGHALPIGVPGELMIGGQGVANGYVRQPDLTSDRFVADPTRPGARVYRTGDLVRRLPDGSLEFLGRLDDQVKIRGHRVEPLEVAQVMAGAPGVNQVAVVPREHAPGDLRLVAYVVSDTPIDVNALRAFVATKLPDVMVPTAMVQIDALPLTPSGKLDRRALPDPESVNDRAIDRFIAPQTATEIQLAEAWMEVLGLQRVGANEDFFALGGHSLLATQVIARARHALNIELPLHALFIAPTVRELATLVEELLVNGEHLNEATDLDVDDELAALLEGMSEEEITQLLGDA